MTKYHKSEGGLWPNTDKQGKQPDKTGHIEITREQMKGLIAMAKEAKPVRIKLAAWDRKAQDTGQPYQWVSGEVFFDPEESQAPPPAPQPIIQEEDDFPF